MESVNDYKDLIRLIPASNQSTIVKKEVWERFSYDNSINEAIFGNDEKAEISRADIRSERDTAKKIVMILMWGYPTGGRGKNIKNVFEKFDVLKSLLSSVKGQNLPKAQADSIIAAFSNIRGLGISTLSKLLCFFDVSIESRKCQIYDLKIVDSLNRKQFVELGTQDTQEWIQDINHYYRYLELVDNIATSISALPEQVELFLFYYNLYYKFI